MTNNGTLQWEIEMESSRYIVSGLKVFDAEGDPVPEIYIRELLDMPSEEFQRSLLSARQKLEVIQAVGLDVLTRMLSDCYKQGGKSYDATQEAELAVLMLGQIVVQERGQAD